MFDVLGDDPLWIEEGLLDPASGRQNFQLSRYLPTEELKQFVEHFWVVRRDLRDRAPYTSKNLPYPSVHMVFERDRSGIFDVATGIFTRQFDGEGSVFAVKFRPGAFSAFVRCPVSRFTNRSVPLRSVFGPPGDALEAAILGASNEDERIHPTGRFLLGLCPEADEKTGLVNRVVDFIGNDWSVLKVEDVCRRFQLSERTLQRLFSNRIGVSPGWVIRRCRISSTISEGLSA